MTIFPCSLARGGWAGGLGEGICQKRKKQNKTKNKNKNPHQNPGISPMMVKRFGQFCAIMTVNLTQISLKYDLAKQKAQETEAPAFHFRSDYWVVPSLFLCAC